MPSEEEKGALLREWLAREGQVAIAYSGGLDSGFLAAVAAEVLGKDALCIILDSAALPRRELARARDTARELSLNYREVSIDLPDGAFKMNSPRRCYHCRKSTAGILRKKADEEGITCLVDGLNQTDYGDYRPGIQANDEAGILHPLAEVGLSKWEIRELAKEMGLGFWNAPPSACLASRIPYGEEIIEEKLRSVEGAEDLLLAIGLTQVRVRLHGSLARIEVPIDEIETLMGSREAVVEGFKALGIDYVALDLEGYRTGSLNLALDRRSDA